jgi:hypothetical protein
MADEVKPLTDEEIAAARALPTTAFMRRIYATLDARDKALADCAHLTRELEQARAALRHIAGVVKGGECFSPCQQDAADIAREALGMPSIDEALAALQPTQAPVPDLPIDPQATYTPDPATDYWDRPENQPTGAAPTACSNVWHLDPVGRAWCCPTCQMASSADLDSPAPDSIREAVAQRTWDIVEKFGEYNRSSDEWESFETTLRRAYPDAFVAPVVEQKEDKG